MGFFTYVIYSPTHKIYYRGFTEDVQRRLFEHNNDLSRYTSGKGPWKLIIVEEYKSKREALIREKALKKCKAEYFQWLKEQPTNKAKLFKDIG